MKLRTDQLQKKQLPIALMIVLLLGCHKWALSQANRQYDVVFHKSYAERALLFDTVVFNALMTLPPAEFEAQVNTLREKARKENDYGAELELIIGRYEYLTRNSLADFDKTIFEKEQLLDGLDKEKYPEYAALLKFDLANNYFGKKYNYSKAFEYYISVYDIVRNYSSVNFPHKKEILVNLGNRYFNFGELDKARELLLQADSLLGYRYKSTNYNNKNTLGLIYRTRGNYDSAIRCFKETELLALKDGDDTWAAIAEGNIGITYYLMGNYALATPLLRIDVASCLKFNSKAYGNAINSLLILADIHLKMDSIAEVAADIATADRYLDSCNDKLKYASGLYSIKSRYNYKTNDLKKAYLFADSAAASKDSLVKRDNIYTLAKVEYKTELEKHKAQLQKLNAEKKLNELTRNGLIIGILLTSAIAWLVVNRQRLRHRTRQNNMQAKKELAERELQNATKQLESYTRHLQEKTVLIERSAEEIERLQAKLADKQMDQVNNEVLQRLYASTILTDDEWEEFKQLFEKVHTGYLQRLKSKMPELSPADKRFIVLSKLDLSNKEMAGIMGVQPETIRSYKHRLRKKFDLPVDASIKEFVDTI